MAMGAPGDDGDAEGGVFADINITPLTDIFLVLLIIFMVTSSAIAEQAADKGGFKVSLPKAGASADATAARDLSVAILADGRVVVGGKVVEEPELRGLLEKAHERSADTLVLVQADEGVAHGRVVAVMDQARRAGLTRLAIATHADGGR